MNRTIHLLLVAGLLQPAFAAAESPSLNHLNALAGAMGTSPVPPAPPAPDGKEPATIQWQDAETHVGQTVTVEGKIVRAFANDKVCFLNFSQEYQNTLTLVIFGSAYPRFPAGPQFYFQDKQVRVTGTVQKSVRGTLQLVLNDPDQIIVISAAASSVLNWEDVTAAYENQVVTVEGVVQTVTVSGKVAFLNFHPNWTRYVAGAIFATTYPRFPSDIKAAYEGKKVRMTGRVKVFEGRPEIVLLSSSQVQVQGGTAEKTFRVALAKERIGFDDGDSLFYEFTAEEGLQGADGKPFKGGLRLLGFDTPEIMHPEDGIFYSQPHGHDAANLTGALFKKSKKIEYVTHGQLDKYGRMLGHLVIDGELLGVSQIRAGLAFEMITPYGDNGFPDEAAEILGAWAKSPIALAIEAGKKPPFMKPGDWRKLNQIHEMAIPRDEWARMSPAKKDAVLAKVKEIVAQRRGAGEAKP